VSDHLSEMCEPFVEETWRHKSLHFMRSDVQSRMLKRKPDKLVMGYTRTMMGFLMFDSRPQRIAILGLGGGSMPKFCYRQLQNTRIDVVEINPYVIALRDAFLVPPDDDRFRVHLDDGARFVAESTRQFDVLLVDAYARHGLPQRLASQEFYDSCRNALVDGGVMVLNLYCGHSDVYLERLRKSFDGAVFSIHEDDRINEIVFACAGDRFQRRRAVPSRASANFTAAAWSVLKPVFRRIAERMPAPV
jgi:spermidine synthase